MSKRTQYGKNNSIRDVKAHHYIISFEPNDPVTMEQALEFGKGKQQQATEKVVNPAVATDVAQDVVVSEDAEPEIVEMEEVVSEVVADIPEVIDYSKLSMEERAEILPVPTDDYQSEYDAYCQRMGYTEEKMKSIRYKMNVYDDFREEYDCRKQLYGVEEVRVAERGKGAR